MVLKCFKISLCCGLLLIYCIGKAQSAKTGLVVTEKALANSFPVFSNTVIPEFYCDVNDAKVVRIAAEAFANDVSLISGKLLKVNKSNKINSKYAIVAGTIGQSEVVDKLIETKLIDVSGIKNKWECFSIQIIKNNSRIEKNTSVFGADELLVITGSDRRGTAFGIFHLSRLMGVSPFVWWADVMPAKRKELFVTGSYISGSPSVQFRGIFINDEDWGLQPWAAKHMDTVIKDIGPNTYAKVFELMLRLKANYIWPAMHPCTKAFYYYKDNPKVADDYAIIVGGSHCEPMLRNNVFEWSENYEHEYGKKPGEWRYDVNKDQIYTYWNDRIKEAINYESVFTVGMRGVHDGSMPGPRDPNEKLKLLENVIIDQRGILNANFKKPANEVPQIFVPYKEVLSLYRRGLPLADDITIIWPDDNHGYIRQLPNENERKRSGGHGVYYHLSYWGAPQDYLWLSSTSPSLIAYEMNKAYQYGAKKLWVFNVGDIKPAELEMQYAMDMAWDIKKGNPETASNYIRFWAEETFGKKLAGPITAIKKEYYELAASGKPEHMNNVPLSKEQMSTRIKRYAALSDKALTLVTDVPLEMRDAYFELILYPVQGANLLNAKILFAKRGFLQNLTNNTHPSSIVKVFHDEIESITEDYNKTIASGKWDGLMDWKPRNQAVFNMPLTYDSASPGKKDSLRNAYAQVPSAQFVIEASSFNRKKETKKTGVQIVPGLGINGKGATVYNKQHLPFSMFDSAYIEFVLPKHDAGNYIVVVKCLPTFDVDRSKNLRYALAVNNESPTTINVHAEADSKEWRENVIRGYSAGRSTHRLSGMNDKMRIYFKDYHLVISTIEFYRN